MSSQPRTGGVYVAPVNVTASLSAASSVLATAAPLVGRGQYTLLANTTYVYPLGGETAPYVSAQLGWDGAIVITSITIEDCNADAVDAPDYSTLGNDWTDEDPTTAFVGCTGAGATATNGVVNVSGGALGSAMFHIGETSAARTRLRVVVGATGGVARCAANGKA